MPTPTSPAPVERSSGGEVQGCVGEVVVRSVGKRVMSVEYVYGVGNRVVRVR